MKQLITHSRQQAFKTCRRQHWYSYELGLRRLDDAKALRMGAAFHEGIAALPDLTAACCAVRDRYARCPEQFDAYWWAIEQETILRLVCAYHWRWENAGLEVVATEQAFQIPLVNPETNKATPSFDLAGKIDGIVRLEDGRLAVKETKTTGDELGHDSPLWRRLRIDHQISLYIHAARQCGFAVDTVLYDVVRKPSIAPTAVPLVDVDGFKIVLDSRGERAKTAKGAWRQTADKDAGLVLQTRPMTVGEWGEKLTADITDRPDFYFARVEIPRLDQDIDEYRSELWDIQQMIREAQKTGRWYRTVNRNTCEFCTYFEACSSGQDVSAAPPGFQFVADVHPELERNGHASTTAPANGAAGKPAAHAATQQVAGA